MEKIHIACACGNEYAPHCGTLLVSIFENNLHNNIDVYILTDELNKKNRDNFEILSSEYKQNISIINIDSSKFEVFKKSNSPIHLPIYTYYRLLLPYILENLEKVLYLDCDMIVRSDLSDIWHIDLSEFAIAGVQDTETNIKLCCERLSIPVPESYYNAGFSLFNLSYMRKENLWEKAVQIMTVNPNLFIYHDQDILNYIFHGKYRCVSVRWNLMEAFLMLKPSIVESQRLELNKYRRNPSIIHYSAASKPWYKECNHPYKDEYWKYQRMSPWTDLKEMHMYSDFQSFIDYCRYLFRTFKYRIKRDEMHIMAKLSLVNNITK